MLGGIGSFASVLVLCGHLSGRLVKAVTARETHRAASTGTTTVKIATVGRNVVEDEGVVVVDVGSTTSP